MEIVKTIKSQREDVRRFLQKTQDGLIIESNYCNLDEHIICISTQIGCKMGCIFCATSLLSNPKDNRFERNLSDQEIIDQTKNIIKEIDKDEKPILFSFMGVGEPFQNYNNFTNAAIRLKKEYPNSRITVSTIGSFPLLIKKLAEEEIGGVVKVHLSLHAPNDKKRRKIMPGAGKIKDALSALECYSKKRGVDCKVNYVLIKNINDSKKDAKELAALLSEYPFSVKLTKLHSVVETLSPASEEVYTMFQSELKLRGVNSVRYESNGQDINAACGQLRKYS